MPLLNIIGITGVGTSFYLSYMFLQTEQKVNYVWALKQLQAIFPQHPQVLITDRDFALINAIHRVFPSSVHFLCQWHIQKNVLARCKAFFTTHSALESIVADNYTEFMQA